MAIRETAKKVKKGLLWAIFPLYAVQKLRETKDSVGRIIEMGRRGNTPVDPDSLSEVQRKRYDLEQEGRGVVLEMEEHQRFEYMANELGWDEAAIEAKMRTLARAHAIRFCLLVFTVIITIGLTAKHGIRPLVFGSAATFYLAATCVKSACLHTQLKERALWSLLQVISRPGRWIWRRAFWFLD